MVLRRRASAIMMLFLALLLSGCAGTLGPELVANSHIEYNLAVSQVLKEEILLNVVRRRYMEAPQFLNISSISSNFSRTTKVGAGGGVSDIGKGDVVDADVSASVTFDDSPTITITPRQGEDMANQLHGPLRVSAVSDLVAAGYPIRGAVNLLVEGINNLRGPDLTYDGFRPGSPEWVEALRLVGKLSADGSLIVDRFRWNDPYSDLAYPAASITPEMWITTLTTGDRRWKSFDDGKTFYFTSHEMAPAMWLHPNARRSPNGQRLMQLLNVRPDVQKKAWLLEPARVPRGSDIEGRPDTARSTLKIRMRSLYNVLNFYAFGVHVPPEHERDGRATDLSSYREAVERGEIEDISDLLAIRCGKDAPESPFQAVRYRGLWFYIDDHDMNSKAGFNALYDLWQLSIKAPTSQSAPVTTIQVN